MAKNTQVQTWINSIRAGDPLAMCKLLAKYHAVLRARLDARMDAALKARVDPEDILQEVYLDVFRRIDRFEDRGPDSFLNWVLTILDNELSDARRAFYCQKRDIAREVSPQVAGATESYWNLLDELYADSATPSRVIRHEEAVGALLACVSNLAEPHRQVIQLRYLEACSVAEVARRLNKSEATVVALSGSALKTLRESMARLGEVTRGT